MLNYFIKNVKKIPENMNKKSENVSLKDVAEYCNVSMMTVSRAFRKNSVINNETRTRILQAAEKLNYRCGNRRGRPQSADKHIPNTQIQLIFGTSSNSIAYFHMRLLTALEQQLAGKGYDCLIRTATGAYESFVRLLENAKNHKCAATLLMGDFQKEQLEILLHTLPGAILLDNSGDDIMNGIYSSFSFDNKLAAILGVKHLINDCKRKRILLINGLKNHFFSDELLAGYRHALNQCGLEYDENLVLNTDFSAESAAAALKQFIMNGGHFDAVFTNDEMATGVYRILHEYRIAIPNDVSICGCDDLPVGKQLYPELTSISLDYAKLAEYAIDHLTDNSKHLTNAVHIKLPPILKPGKSSKTE